MEYLKLSRKAFSKRFEQQTGQNAEEYGGTGLGLSITRRLVELMGGTLSLHSELNKGSTFTISLENVPIPHTPSRPVNHASLKPGIHSI